MLTTNISVSVKQGQNIMGNLEEFLLYVKSLKVLCLLLTAFLQLMRSLDLFKNYVTGKAYFIK